jgi:hypothetical protein
MLKTYRIIPLVFILFLFGFTLFTVAPVFAEDSPEFIACQQIKPSGDFRLMKQKKNCFRDVARLHQVASVNSAVTPSDPSGGEVAELNAKLLRNLRVGFTGLQGDVRTLQEQSGGEVAQLNAKISGLEAGLTGLQGVVRTLQEQSKNSMQPVAPTANTGGGIAGLDAKDIKFLIKFHDLLCSGDLWAITKKKGVNNKHAMYVYEIRDTYALHNQCVR